MTSVVFCGVNNFCVDIADWKTRGFYQISLILISPHFQYHKMTLITDFDV